jgi:hypothetical protein
MHGKSSSLHYRLLCSFLRANDLGVATWYANALAPPELVALDELSGHVVVVDILVRNTQVWVTVPFDHVCTICFVTFWHSLMVS